MVAASDIEAIVQEVLRRLQRLSAATAAPSAPASTSQSANASTTANGSQDARPGDAKTLRLTDRVITLAQLAGRLEGVQNLLVLPRAVVTPAVQDELRSRSIRWSRCSQLAATSRAAPYIVATTLPEVGRAVATLAGTSVVRRVIDAEDEQDAVRKLSAEIENATRGVLIVARPFAAAHAARGDTKLRAAYVRGIEEIEAARKQIEANVLVFDARQTKAHSIAHCLRAAGD